MHSLSELKQFLESKQIKVKKYNGYQLIVGKSSWGMAHDVIYCDKDPVPKKEILNRAQQCIKEDIDNVTNNSTKTRNWRGIGSGRLLRDGDDG